MSLRVAVAIALLALAGHAFSLPSGQVVHAKTNFNNFKVVRASVQDREQQIYLHRLQQEDSELDFWAEPKLHGFADIMVSEEKLGKFVALLKKRNISFEILISDVQKLITEEEERRAQKFQSGAAPAAIDWKEYYDLESIQNFLQELARDRPSTVQILNIGSSGEGRNMTVVKLTNGSGTSKPAILITATIHAREWIAAATATYIINQLATNSSAHPDILDRVDFYILPVINPDGYSYTHTSNRLWRKTRSNTNPSSGCRGVDANRNFDFKWGEADVPGSSGSPCSETYRGPQPFSEPEAASVRDFVENSRNVNWTAYLTLHSYGQYFLSPWGFTQNLPANYLTMKTLADNSAAALTSLYGTVYTVGSSANVLYYTDGTDQDWATGSGNFNISYTMELRDTGNYGFVLPASQILPTARETFEAIKVLARGLP